MMIARRYEIQLWLIFQRKIAIFPRFDFHVAFHLRANSSQERDILSFFMVEMVIRL